MSHGPSHVLSTSSTVLSLSQWASTSVYNKLGVMQSIVLFVYDRWDLYVLISCWIKTYLYNYISLMSRWLPQTKYILAAPLCPTLDIIQNVPEMTLGWSQPTIWNLTKDLIRTARKVKGQGYKVDIFRTFRHAVSAERDYWKNCYLYDASQAGSDSLPVSERPRSTVRVGLLCPGRQCWHSATAAFQQPSTSCSTTLPAQYLWLPGLFSSRPHSLEFSPGFYRGPDHQCRLFQRSA